MEKDSIQVFSDRNQIDKATADLMKKAMEATQDAYAPYSNFFVGAAVLLDNGKVIKGSNFENASYPLCLCAERVALGSVHSQHPGAVVKAIAVTANNKAQDVNEPVAPCGACRQVLFEYEQKQGKPMRVIMFGGKGNVVISETAAQLLPMAFDHKFLE